MSWFSESYQVWFPGTLVWELWFVDRRKGARIVDTCDDSRLLDFSKVNGRKKVLAMPTGNQLSTPFFSSAFTETGLLRGAKDRIKQSGIECDFEGIGVQPVTGYPPKTVARVDTPVVGKRIHEFSDNLIPDLIVPAPSLVLLPSDSVSVWTELRKTVIAVERDGLPIHYQELDGDRDIDHAREIRDIIFKLKADKVLRCDPTIYLCNQSTHEPYENILRHDVVTGYRGDPSNTKTILGMKPKRIRENEEARVSRRKQLIKQGTISFAIVATSLFMAGTYAMAYFQTKHQQQCVIANQPQTERLTTIKTQWDDMAPAVDRNASVLETWRKIFTMPSSGNINISRMAIGRNQVELTCEARSLNAALKYIDELATTRSLASFSWDYSVPENLLDGTAIFTVKGFKL